MLFIFHIYQQDVLLQIGLLRISSWDVQSAEQERALEPKHSVEIVLKWFCYANILKCCATKSLLMQK